MSPTDLAKELKHCRTLARNARDAVLNYLGSPAVAEPHGSSLETDLNELRPLFETLYALNCILEDEDKPESELPS